MKTLSRNVRVIPDPFAFEAGLDKYKAHAILREEGVSVPDTVLFEYNALENTKNVINEWGSALIKPRRGAFGKGVAFVDNFFDLRDWCDYIHSTTNETPDKGYFLERYYDNNPKEWVSISIINGNILYGYRKHEKKFFEMRIGKKKVYDEKEIGGEVDGCEIPDSFKKEAMKAYNALGAQIIGFDIINSREKGPVIVDENTFPGYYEEIFDSYGLDSTDVFFSLIKDEINKVDKN